MGKSRDTVLHHVGMLENAGMLNVRRAGGYMSIHPDGSSEAGTPKEAVLRSPVAQRLLQAVAAAPGATVGDLARRLGVAQPTVSRHVARLGSAGLLEKVREGRTTRLYAPEQPATLPSSTKTS